MQSHQRYFPLGGNRFALVANGGDPETVKAGNETVLEGRLDDATFTLERDLAAGIEELVGRLDSIVYLAGAGSFADKAERLQKLVDRLGGGDASLEAARLAKADQAAELVREFPSFEGYIGAEYARLAGFPKRSVPPSPSSTCPTPPAARSRRRSRAGCSPPPTRSTRRRSRSRSGTSRRPPRSLRPATGGDRPVPACHRRRSDDPLRPPHRGGRRVRGGEVRRAAARRSGRVRPRCPGRERARSRSVARLAQALAGLPDERLEPIHTAYVRAGKLGSEEAAAKLDPKLLTEPAEQEVTRELEQVEPEIASALETADFDAAVEAGAKLGPVLHRFFEDVLDGRGCRFAETASASSATFATRSGHSAISGRFPAKAPT